ncbi:unnamed protein product, partial [Prorocentrum cordatum]
RSLAEVMSRPAPQDRCLPPESLFDGPVARRGPPERPKLARNLRLACLTTLPLWASPNAEAAQAAGTFVYSSQRGAGRGRERAPAARGLAGCVLVRPVLPNTRG